MAASGASSVTLLQEPESMLIKAQENCNLVVLVGSQVSYQAASEVGRKGV